MNFVADNPVGLNSTFVVKNFDVSGDDIEPLLATMTLYHYGDNMFSLYIAYGNGFTASFTGPTWFEDAKQILIKRYSWSKRTQDIYLANLNYFGSLAKRIQNGKPIYEPSEDRL